MVEPLQGIRNLIESADAIAHRGSPLAGFVKAAKRDLATLDADRAAAPSGERKPCGHRGDCEHGDGKVLIGATPHPEPAPDRAGLREALTEWGKGFLDGLSFNVPTLQENGWAERRAPDIAGSILSDAGVRAALLSQPTPLDVERLARALHNTASASHRHRYAEVGAVSGDGRDACEFDAGEVAAEYARLSEDARRG